MGWLGRLFGIGDGLPSWAKRDGNVLVVDAEGAFADYLSRLGYPQEGFNREQLGVARRCMTRDLQKDAPVGTTIRMKNAGRFNPDKCAPGGFIDWSKEYARISAS